jgi:hypothetical protein
LESCKCNNWFVHTLGKRDSSEHADNNPLKSRGQLEDAFYKQRGKTSLLLGPYPSLEGEGWNRFFHYLKKLLSFMMLDRSIVYKYKRTQHPIREHTYSKHKCITKVSPHLAGRRIHIQTSLQNKSVRSTQEFTDKGMDVSACLYTFKE